MLKLFVMRNAALTLLLFVTLASATNAQRFSLLPQVGFESSKTNVSYNNQEKFSPLGTRFSPQASLILQYASKKGHGLFAGIASSRNAVDYQFSDPENGMTQYSATEADMQLRFEGGYQFTFKPIYFNNSKSSSSKTSSGSSTKKSCGSAAKSSSSCGKPETTYSRCGSSKQKTEQKNVAKGGWMRIQPSVGMAYIATDGPDIVAKTQNGQQVYSYPAGGWNTAVMGGLGFEFGKNKTRMLTVNVNYLKGLGNLDDQTMTTVSGTKTTTTTLSSSSDAWSLRIGIPFTLGSSSAKTSAAKQETKKKDCFRYYSAPSYRCRGGM